MIFHSLQFGVIVRQIPICLTVLGAVPFSEMADGGTEYQEIAAPLRARNDVVVGSLCFCVCMGNFQAGRRGQCRPPYCIGFYDGPVFGRGCFSFVWNGLRAVPQHSRIFGEGNGT